MIIIDDLLDKYPEVLSAIPICKGHNVVLLLEMEVRWSYDVEVVVGGVWYKTPNNPAYRIFTDEDYPGKDGLLLDKVTTKLINDGYVINGDIAFDGTVVMSLMDRMKIHAKVEISKRIGDSTDEEEHDVFEWGTKMNPKMSYKPERTKWKKARPKARR
jgi:hypothetical protein